MTAAKYKKCFQIPEYGGSYIDESEQLNILVTGKTQKSAQAQEALKTEITNALMEVERKYGGSTENLSKAGRATLKEAQYSFKQLNDWKTQIRYELMGNGVNAISIKDEAGKILIKVSSNEKESILTQIKTNLRIDLDAIIVDDDNVISSIPNLLMDNVQNKLSDTCYSIRDNALKCDNGKLMTGTPIYTPQDNNSYKDCSIGLVAELNGRKGFISASHCSKTMYNLDGDNFLHREYSGANNPIFGDRIAKEARDPKTNIGSSCVKNSRQYPCRFSETMFATFNEDNELVAKKIQLGSISTFIGGTGLSIDKVDDVKIVGAETNLILNQVKDYRRIGMITGGTYGYKLEDNCEDRLADSNTSTPHVLLCHLVFRGIDAQSGDSGGLIYTSSLFNGYEALVVGFVSASRPHYSDGDAYLYVSNIRYTVNMLKKRENINLFPCDSSELCNTEAERFEYRYICARHNYLDYQECKSTTPVTSTGTGTSGGSGSNPINYNFVDNQASTIERIQAARKNANYTQREIKQVYDYTLRRNAVKVNDMAQFNYYAKYVEYYDMKCIGIGIQGSQIIDCWDNRYIPIESVNFRVRGLLKTTSSYSRYLNAFSLSLVKGTSIVSEFSYLYKNTRDYSFTMYEVGTHMPLLLENIYYPMLIEKQSIDLLEAAYYAPKPPTQICKDILNCNPPKPPVMIEEAKL